MLTKKIKDKNKSSLWLRSFMESDHSIAAIVGVIHLAVLIGVVIYFGVKNG